MAAEALTLRELCGTPREWAIRLSLGAAVGAFLGVIGPFGSYAMPLPVRLGFWVAGFLLGVVAYSLPLRFAVRLAPRVDLPEWFAIGVAMALVSAPYALVLGLLFHGLVWPRFTARTALELYGQTLLLGAPFAAFNVMLHRWRNAGASPAPAAPSAPAPDADPGAAAATARALAGEVIALQMEDHYVRVHRPGRSELALMPMAQAVGALEATPGLRVHRSWWVAKDAVEGHAFEGRNLRLRLRGGLEAPVARAQVAEVRAAGWLGEAPAPR